MEFRQWLESAKFDGQQFAQCHRGEGEGQGKRRAAASKWGKELSTAAWKDIIRLFPCLTADDPELALMAEAPAGRTCSAPWSGQGRHIN